MIVSNTDSAAVSFQTLLSFLRLSDNFSNMLAPLYLIVMTHNPRIVRVMQPFGHLLSSQLLQQKLLVVGRFAHMMIKKRTSTPSNRSSFYRCTGARKIKSITSEMGVRKTLKSLTLVKLLNVSVFDKKFTVRDGLRCWLFQISVLSASDLFLPEQTGGWAGRRGRSGIQNHKHTAKTRNTVEIPWKYSENTA